jgi:thiamine-phosphate diphosphorylase
VRVEVPKLHAVTDDGVLAQLDFLERAQRIATGPDVAIHLRGNRLGGELLRLADALMEIASATGTRILVNDRSDIARASNAHGVHLPARGLPVAEARKLVRPGLLVGRSVHSSAQAREELAAGADYVMLGPIWATASHPGRIALGLDAVTQIGLNPVIAVGGVTPERARVCRAAGVHGVAAISALWQADDPGTAVREFLLSLT